MTLATPVRGGCDSGYSYACMTPHMCGCIYCAPGQYQDAANGHSFTSCKECDPGTFATNTASIHCTDCPHGQFQPASGAKTACTPWENCGPGRFFSPNDPPSATKDRPCENCNPGKYTVHSNQAAYWCHAQTCGANTYVFNDPPSTISFVTLGCVACPKGYGNAAGDNTDYGDTSCDPIICGTGKKVVANECVACAPGTENDALEPALGADTACTACPLGTFRSGTGGPSCTNHAVCPPGTYQTTAPSVTKDTVCTDCGIGKFQNLNGQTSCKDCDSGKYQSGTGGPSCAFPAACTPGTYQTAAPSATTDRVCTACFPGFFQSSTDGSPCTNHAAACAPGTYQTVAPSATTDRVCITCSPGTFKSSSMFGCTNCGIGTFQNLNGQTSCKDCETGKYQNLIGQTSCTDCGTDQYQNQIGQTSCMGHKVCPPGTSQTTAPSATTDTVCTNCGTDQYQNQIGQTSCMGHKVCPPGTSQMTAPSATTDRVCTNCEPGQYQSGSGGTSCTNCGTGQYQSGSGGTSCTNCGTGQYQSGSGGTSCTNCGTGQYQSGSGGTSCVNHAAVCTSGTSQTTTPSATTDRVCTKCGIGTFQNHTDKTSCTNCGTGQYQNLIGQTSCKDHYVCPAGTSQGTTTWYGTYGSPPSATTDRVCENCVPGKYQNAPNAGYCRNWRVTCRPGNYESLTPSATDQRRCAPCPSGYYSDQISQTSMPSINVVCTNCEPGKYSNKKFMYGTRGSASCDDHVVPECTPGTYQTVAPSAITDRVCTNCSTGQYQNQTGQTSCTDCGTGQYQSGSGGASCMQHKVCTPGTYQTTAPSATTDTVCTACGTGQYQNQTGQTSCNHVAVCTPGMHQTTAPSAATNRVCAATLCGPNERVESHACVTCPALSTNAAGDSAAGSNTACDPTICAADERVESNGCVACPPGTTNAAGDTVSGPDTTCDPTLCAVNEYVLNHTCTTCYPGTVNAAGDDASGPGTACGFNMSLVCIHPDVTVHVLVGVSSKAVAVGSLDVGDLVIGEGRTSTVKQIARFKVEDEACLVPKDLCEVVSAGILVSRTHAVRCPSWPTNTWTFCQPDWERVATTEYVHVELESYLDDHLLSGSVVLESWDGYARAADTIEEACDKQGCPWPHKWAPAGEQRWTRVDLRQTLFDSSPRLRVERT